MNETIVYYNGKTYIKRTYGSVVVNRAYKVIGVNQGVNTSTSTNRHMRVDTYIIKAN